MRPPEVQVGAPASRAPAALGLSVCSAGAGSGRLVHLAVLFEEKQVVDFGETCVRQSFRLHRSFSECPLSAVSGHRPIYIRERWNSCPALDLEYDLRRCGMSHVLIALTIAFALSAVSVAFSQLNPSGSPTNTDASGGVTQPQGKTGPLNTKSGGAPASSPQGETPSGMQAAPKGSDKTIRTDGNDVPEGTPKE